MNLPLLPPILCLIVAISGIKAADMRKLALGLLGVLLGSLVGAALALGICIAAGYLSDIPQFEGAYAMGVILGWMPPSGVAGGIVGAVWAVSRV